MEDESSSGNKGIDDSGELQIIEELKICGLTVMSDDLPGDMEMAVVLRILKACRLQEKHVPDFRVIKPMLDLCWVCQQNSAAIMRITNLPIERQTTVGTKEAATLLKGLFTNPVTGLSCLPLSRPLAELDIMAHYNFDYAQQVHIL
uniref:Uncharacterized protein n=1 Tax=Amphimedon queenslandica TaxID=400682 RepID=A0A1X7UQI6_AMPQE